MRKLILTTALLAALAGCHSDDPAPQIHTGSLTELQLQKKGSTEPVAVNGLPVQGAVITRE